MSKTGNYRSCVATINGWNFNFEEMRAFRDPNGPRYGQGFWDSFHLREHNGKIYRHTTSHINYETGVKGVRLFFDKPEDGFNAEIQAAYEAYLFEKHVLEDTND